MPFRIGGNEPLDVKHMGGSGFVPKQRVAPMNMFGDSSITRGGTPGVRANGIGGDDAMAMLLAQLGNKKTARSQAFDTSSIGNSLFKGGMGSGGGLSNMLGGLLGGGGGGGGIGGMLQGILGKILPMIMSLFGGGGGGGGGGMFGGGI